MTISHCVPSNKVNRNAFCSAGTSRMHAIRRADTTKETINQGLCADPVSAGGHGRHKDALYNNTAYQIFFKQSARFYWLMLHNVLAGRINTQCQGRQGSRGKVYPQNVNGQKGCIPVKQGCNKRLQQTRLEFLRYYQPKGTGLPSGYCGRHDGLP